MSVMYKTSDFLRLVQSEEIFTIKTERRLIIAPRNVTEIALSALVLFHLGKKATSVSVSVDKNSKEPYW